jgi:hypothetical protein
MDLVSNYWYCRLNNCLTRVINNISTSEENKGGIPHKNCFMWLIWRSNVSCWFNCLFIANNHLNFGQMKNNFIYFDRKERANDIPTNYRQRKSFVRKCQIRVNWFSSSMKDRSFTSTNSPYLFMTYKSTSSGYIFFLCFVIFNLHLHKFIQLW